MPQKRQVGTEGYQCFFGSKKIQILYSFSLSNKNTNDIGFVMDLNSDL